MTGLISKSQIPNVFMKDRLKNNEAFGNSFKQINWKYEFFSETNPRYQCYDPSKRAFDYYGQLGWFGMWDGHSLLENGIRSDYKKASIYGDWIRQLGNYRARRKTKTAEECADLCNLAGRRKCAFFEWGDVKCAFKRYGCPTADCVFYKYFSKRHRLNMDSQKLDEYKKDQDDHFFTCARFFNCN